MRRFLDGPWIATAAVLYLLFNVADVLFTGGRPIAAISPLVTLAALAYIASTREHADARRR